MEKLKNLLPAVVVEKFRPATLSFLFIIVYINLFQMVFGPENTIVGVIFAILMSASMVRDMTATPLRHLLAQAAVLAAMAAAAFLVTVLPPLWAFAVNFVAIFLILYTYTYEYASHMYFPYILSYLFLIFITPVTPARLPVRLCGILVGAVSIIAYQLFMGRKRVVETAQDVLGSLIDDADRSIRILLLGGKHAADPAQVRHKLSTLSRTVYDRRKKILCVPDASFHMIDAGRGLEYLLLLTQEMELPLTQAHRQQLEQVCQCLADFRAFVSQSSSTLPPLPPEAFPPAKEGDPAASFPHLMAYIRDRLLHMTDPEKQVRYPKTALSFRVRLFAALDVSQVRMIYALRVALLLALGTLAVQLLALPHGRWLLFTMASVSLPYADDVPTKTAKRIAATLLGGAVSVVIYTLVPSSIGRTIAMMLSGYVSYYFSDYTATFAFSTVGALGGAVFLNTFGLTGVGGVFTIRVCYILAGAAIAYAANCFLFPYRRRTATSQLLQKYRKNVELLSAICRTDNPDPQLYYNLVIQAHLQEDKLSQNAAAGGWTEIQQNLTQLRAKVRQAHRARVPGREDAPVFEAKPLRKDC